MTVRRWQSEDTRSIQDSPYCGETGMLTALLAVWAILAPAKVEAANPDTAARCAQVRNDDTVRPYDPSLRLD